MRNKAMIISTIRDARTLIRELPHYPGMEDFPAANKLIKEAYDKISRAHEAIASRREPE